MKKVIATFIVLSLVFSLAACAGGSGSSASPSAAVEAKPTASSGAEESPSDAGASDIKGLAYEMYDPTEGVFASDISKKIADDRGVSTVGWYTDDVDWFGRDAYKVCYLHQQAYVITEQLLSSLKSWGSRVNLDVSDYCSNNDNDAMVSAIESYSTQGYDGLIIEPDPQIGERIIELCKELEMPWFTALNPISNKEGQRIYPGVSLNNDYCGRSQIQWLIDNYATYWGNDVDMKKVGVICLTLNVNSNFKEINEGARNCWLENFPDLGDNYFTGDTVAETPPVSAEAGYNVAGAIMAANSQFDRWFIVTVLEDYGQGAKRVAESMHIDDKVLICTNGANIAIPAWKDGSEDGKCWVAALHYGMDIFTECMACGLIALIEGRATPETLYSEWILPGTTGATVPCNTRIVTKETYQDYLDTISAYLDRA